MSVVSARSLEQALRTLAGPPVCVLAGGTDLMVEFESGRTRPARVLDIWRVPELRGIEPGAGGLRLGALTTCAELCSSPLVRQHAALLSDAAREVGAVQIQNRATLGGNLGTASPAADLNPVLVALGARVRLVSLRGARELAVEQFLTGYRSTARAPDELIESVVVPPRPAREVARFRKVGTRRAQSIAKLVVAVALARDPQGRVCAVRAAAGSVAERTLRLERFERELQGQVLTLERLRHAARASAGGDIRPRDDVRSTAEYRRHVVARVLEDLFRDLSATS